MEIKKYIREAIILATIIVLFFALRLPNLTLQPIFADEAIYVRWAQVMRAEPTLRFLPQTDGKTPLFMWVMIPFFKLIHDPLLAGRFLSVMSGLVTLLGVYFLSRQVFGKRVGLWATLLYALVPYTVFFDRMALVDSMLSAFTIWALNLAIWLIKFPRLDLSMFLGYLLGGALLTKTPAMVNLLTLPVTLVAFNFRKAKKYALAKLVGLWAVACLIALAMYNILRLGPEFNQLSSRNQDYVFSPTWFLAHPTDPFLPHLGNIIDWWPKLLTWPVAVALLLGIGLVIYRRKRFGIVIFLWALLPLLLLMFTLKSFTARYLLFTIPPFLVLAGYAIDEFIRSPATSILKIPQKVAGGLLVVLVAVTPLYFNYLLLTDPQKAPLPKAERRGYLEDWTAGYGFPDIAQFLKQERAKGAIVVGTEGYFGTLQDGLHIYLDKDQIPIIGGGATISATLRDSAKKQPTFFIGNRNRLSPPPDRVTLLKEYPKAQPLGPEPQDAIVVYKVNP